MYMSSDDEDDDDDDRYRKFSILLKFFMWSVALYGAETWTLRRNEQKHLEAFEMWVWRRMERVKWTDKIKNAVVLERVG